MQNMQIEKQNLLKLISKFKGKNILIVGDVMLDKFIAGGVSRISPEAPVQVVSVNRESYVPGGAGNVASNIAALGGNGKLVGIVGTDHAGEIIKSELRQRKIEPLLVETKSRPTTQKIRVLAQNQQLLRIDYEEEEKIDHELENHITETITKHLDKTDIIVVSDYAKGVITKKIMALIISSAKKKKIPVLIDPKPKNKEFYKGATLITPNHKEANQMCSLPDNRNDESLINVGTRLAKELKTNVLITRGEKGMSLFEIEKQKITQTHIPTKAKEVYDVTGAGDTVIGTLAVALAAGATLKEAMTLANHAAGIVVGKVGTATCSVEELNKAVSDNE
ncbi:MAG: D-glycero-beta-D-manno-heptose-7-phosphate kinase [Nanoarchaeota archaeon]|nr:D-glycero-beta-D-manno-heptose-7-phosphate kinase [Nanoarchaeota archaeon]